MKKVVQATLISPAAPKRAWRIVKSAMRFEESSSWPVTIPVFVLGHTHVSSVTVPLAAM